MNFAIHHWLSLRRFILQVQLCKWGYIRKRVWFMRKSVGIKIWQTLNEISQDSQEVTYKVAGLQVCNIIKKRLQHRCFPVNIAK